MLLSPAARDERENLLARRPVVKFRVATVAGSLRPHPMDHRALAQRSCSLYATLTFAAEEN